MKPWTRRGLGMMSALLLGAAAFVLFGEGPGTATAADGLAVDWALPALPSQELSATDEVWEMRTPWGGRPAGIAGEGEPETPPLMLVGVVVEDDGSRAVFVVPGQGEVQAKAGDPLPGGGQVTRVTPFLVAWTDGGGTQHEQALLADFSAPLPAADTTPGAVRAPDQPPASTGPSGRPQPPDRSRPPPRKPTAPPPRRP